MRHSVRGSKGSKMVAGTLAVGVGVWWVIASGPGAQAQEPKPSAVKPSMSKPAAGGAAARGKYLVTHVADCGGCHTPAKIGPNGPEPDETRMLSGVPASAKVASAPAPNETWAGYFSLAGAFGGPWGVSYPANLTPDKETGLGAWTEQQFIDTLRTGRHQGRGREILPPMPWRAFRNMTDGDLKAIFAYLRTIPPVSNKVPDPVIAGAPAPPKK
jgi:mono/diheme cytochrome c family protein